MSPNEALVPPETAYYYPEWHWEPEEHGWIKSLLLFFDEIALLVPNFKSWEPAAQDPILTGPLIDMGLVRMIEPESFVDHEMTEELVSILMTFLGNGVFDNLPEVDSFPTLSRSRAGFPGYTTVAEEALRIFAEKGLARPSEDGWSIPMHPTVRTSYLTILAQLSRAHGRRWGLDLHPTTNELAAKRSLVQTLDLDGMPSQGRIVDFDLQNVSIDLDAVPLDELLDFRTAHGDQHRRYMANLRQFCREVSAIDDEVDRLRAFEDRAAELREASEALTSHAFKEFKRPKTIGGFALGLVGAGIPLVAGPIGAAVVVGAAASIAGAALALVPDKEDSTAYSYLFSAQRHF